jgi:hypothetical protein
VAGVRRLMEFQRETNYYDLYMNEETSRYVFRIMALKEIMNSPTKYGFEVNKDRYELIPTRKIEIDTSITDLVALLKHKE